MYTRDVKTNAPERTAGDVAAAALLRKHQLAEFLQLTPRTVENLHQRGLPHFRIGPRRNRYDKAAVLTWLDRTSRVGRSGSA